MKNEVTFFLPIRKGSQRVIHKNTRPFASIEGGILELKLRQLLKSTMICEVLLSTNDKYAMEIARQVDADEKLIRVIPRPEHLCLDTTPLGEVINYVPEVVDSPHILWGHVTTPFVEAKDYDKGIQTYFDQLSQGYDSLVGVTRLQNFLLRENGQVFNYDQQAQKWPRTQDLTPLFEVNHAMFLSSRDIYLKQHDRLGSKPYLFEMDKIRSFDIDWEDDFYISEAIYEKLFS